QIAAVIIHQGIGSRGIFAQNVIKHDQRLDDDFPTGLPNVLETADLIADTIRSGGILKQTAAALRNLLEQYQLQDWDQRPQLRHLKDGDFLKSLDVIGEAGFAETILGCGEIVLGQCRYSRNNVAVASTSLRKIGGQIESCMSICEFRFQQESSFTQQPEIAGHTLL